jgi:hypothetical protein
MRKIVFCTLIALAPVAASAEDPVCTAVWRVDENCEPLQGFTLEDLCTQRDIGTCQRTGAGSSAATSRQEARLKRLLVRAENALTQCQANAKGKRALRRCNRFQRVINRILNALAAIKSGR